MSSLFLQLLKTWFSTSMRAKRSEIKREFVSKATFVVGKILAEETNPKLLYFSCQFVAVCLQEKTQVFTRYFEEQLFPIYKERIA